MSKKRVLVLLLVIVMTSLGLAQSCTTRESGSSEQLVAVATLMSHPALDAAGKHAEINRKTRFP